MSFLTSKNKSREKSYKNKNRKIFEMRYLSLLSFFENDNNLSFKSSRIDDLLDWKDTIGTEYLIQYQYLRLYIL